MSDARAEIMNRIRRALSDVEGSTQTDITRDYRRADAGSREDMVALLIERLRDYRAYVRLVDPSQIARAVTAICVERGVHRLAIPADLPDSWLPDTVETVRDHILTPAELDAAGGALTGCALAIAETGTIALDAGAYQGRRILTLLPDLHICVIQADQIVALPPEGLERLHEAAVEGRPITLIAGPSATSDIELSRVEGVHGPRTLEVLVIQGRPE